MFGQPDEFEPHLENGRLAGSGHWHRADIGLESAMFLLCHRGQAPPSFALGELLIAVKLHMGSYQDGAAIQQVAEAEDLEQFLGAG